MNLLPLTLEIATSYGCNKKVSWKDWSENFRKWTNIYATALGVRDLEFTPVDEDYKFDDAPNKIYLLRKDGKKTYYISIHDRNWVTEFNEPLRGLFLSEQSIFSERNRANSFRPTYTTTFSHNPEGPGYGYSLLGYYIFKNQQPFVNWNETPWEGK